ncbi:calcium-transporting ATPase 5, plasma membrane-type-like isoform X2 [Arachis ipaensis]|uniref:calcium-transporting ATPase 5, plasma membrane-type-like isoform X2 n=1 Tax=Arachis ipaensis TaxID=130454 RepID=UPI000A2B0C31|nr:calcium-transporting ATPase 5, plasma membrane-type-like isoform X2 [Arachis ipaensis]
MSSPSILRKSEADNGLSMSIQETEVAKESYDIIILDDNLASVVKFQLTVNIAALVMNVVATVSAEEVPLNVVQVNHHFLTL